MHHSNREMAGSAAIAAIPICRERRLCFNSLYCC